MLPTERIPFAKIQVDLGHGRGWTADDYPAAEHRTGRNQHFVPVFHHAQSGPLVLNGSARFFMWRGAHLDHHKKEQTGDTGKL